VKEMKRDVEVEKHREKLGVRERGRPKEERMK